MPPPLGREHRVFPEAVKAPERRVAVKKPRMLHGAPLYYEKDCL